VEDGVTVGETIADARGAAGLSVNEVSERTRIRETVIRSIEQDDFDALGGDLYVRGYLRAIAGVVGVDPQPLIREFDAARGAGPAGWPTLSSSSQAAAAGEAEAVAGTEDAAGPKEVAEPEAAVGASADAEAGEAVVAEDGVADEELAADEEPVADEPPVADDQPAVFDQPAAFDQPTVFDQPLGPGDFPTRVDQPAIVFDDHHINEDYPTVADQPAIVDEPAFHHSWGSPSWNPVTWESETLASDDYHPFWADDAVSDADPAPVAQAAFAEPTVAIPAAERAPAGLRRGAGGSSRPPARSPRRSRVRGWRWATVISILVVGVLGVVGVASGQIVAKLRHTSAAPGASATVTPTVVLETTPPPPSPTPTPSPPPTPAPKPKPAPVPARQLAVQSVAAYGPAGTADGDHPEKAGNVVASDPAQPWQTDWYATAKFGALKSGTGLLLDMGSPVTVTSLRIRLGSVSGTNLQIAVGNSPDLSVMSTQASTQNASGRLTLHLVKPTRARYVVIWFTKLPPFAVGQYRVSVYSVTVSGRPQG
jgi:hypothetical protein